MRSKRRAESDVANHAEDDQLETQLYVIDVEGRIENPSVVLRGLGRFVMDLQKTQKCLVGVCFPASEQMTASLIEDDKTPVEFANALKHSAGKFAGKALLVKAWSGNYSKKSDIQEIPIPVLCSNRNPTFKHNKPTYPELDGIFNGFSECASYEQSPSAVVVYKPDFIGFDDFMNYLSAKFPNQNHTTINAKTGICESQAGSALSMVRPGSVRQDASSDDSVMPQLRIPVEDAGLNHKQIFFQHMRNRVMKATNTPLPPPAPLVRRPSGQAQKPVPLPLRQLSLTQLVKQYGGVSIERTTPPTEPTTPQAEEKTDVLAADSAGGQEKGASAPQKANDELVKSLCLSKQFVLRRKMPNPMYTINQHRRREQGVVSDDGVAKAVSIVRACSKKYSDPKEKLENEDYCRWQKAVQHLRFVGLYPQQRSCNSQRVREEEKQTKVSP